MSNINFHNTPQLETIYKENTSLIDEIVANTVKPKKPNPIKDIQHFYGNYLINQEITEKDYWAQCVYKEFNHSDYLFKQEYYSQFPSSLERIKSQYKRIRMIRPVYEKPNVSYWEIKDLPIASKSTAKTEEYFIYEDEYGNQLTEDQYQALITGNTPKSKGCKPGCACSCKYCDYGNCQDCNCNRYFDGYEVR